MAFVQATMVSRLCRRCEKTEDETHPKHDPVTRPNHALLGVSLPGALNMQCLSSSGVDVHHAQESCMLETCSAARAMLRCPKR